MLKSDTKRVNQIEFDKYKKPLSDRTILLSIHADGYSDNANSAVNVAKQLLGKL